MFKTYMQAGWGTVVTNRGADENNKLSPRFDVTR